MFRTLCTHHQGSKLYYTAPGIITPVGGRPVHRLRAGSARHLYKNTIIYNKVELFTQNFLVSADVCV